MRPRILIDGIAFSHPQPGGYKTYSLNLVWNLAQLDSDCDFLLALDRPATGPKGWQSIVVGRPGSARVVWREQFQLPRLASREKADLLHATVATGPVSSSVPMVATIYDTMEFTDPLPRINHTKRWAMRVYSRAIQATVARRAAHILTISQYAKRRISKGFGIADDRITVTLLAPGMACRPLDEPTVSESVERRWGISGYLLGIASSATRKNTHGLLRAYAALPQGLRDRHPLALVCSHKGLRNRLQVVAGSLGIAANLVLLEAVTDDEMILLYNAAVLLAFPSLEEGFGLPPLEAMACGTPVIASNSSSLPEVVGDAGILVERGSEEALVAAMDSILTDQALAAELRERGLAQAARFSWRRTAEQTLEVYRQVIAGRRL